MSCSNCPQTTPIPECVETLQVGYTEYDNEDIYVYIQNDITGMTFIASVTTDSNGLLIIDPFPAFSENFTYSLWAVRKADKCKERMNILVGCNDYGYMGETVTCIDLVIQKYFNTSGEVEVFSSHVIELE